MLNRLRKHLEWYLMDDTSPLPVLIWRYLKTRWRGFVWHVRSEWLHIDPFDHSDAMWEEDDDHYDEWYGDDDDSNAVPSQWDDYYPGADYIEVEWDFDDLDGDD